ncbi:MAG: biopolymer transporter ExbD [Verrucomicrobiota bacterium]|jgi:biopolymer transport protein ExbD
MKKCSHTAHRTLSELNITPLLDLAFVLLVIFILTTTPLANDLPLKLPAASKHLKDPPHDPTYITVQEDGKTYLDKRLVDINGLRDLLVGMRFDDTNLSVIVRGDAKTKYRQIRAVLDVCQGSGVGRFDLATETADQKKS